MRFISCTAGVSLGEGPRRTQGPSASSCACRDSSARGAGRERVGTPRGVGPAARARDRSACHGAFRTQVTRHWLHALRSRSQRDRMTWERMRELSARWLPMPRILHPWPIERFRVRTQGKSPVR